MFRFEYTVTEADYAAFNLHCALTRSRYYERRRGRLLRRCLLAAVLCALSGVLLLAGAGHAPLASLNVALAAVVLLATVFQKRLLAFQIRQTLKAMQRRGKLPFSREGVLTFDEDGLTDAGVLSTVQTPYAAIEAVETDEANGAAYILTAVGAGFIVPARCFASAAERERFSAFIRERTGGIS